MNEVLALEQVAAAAEGPTLTMGLGTGQLLTVVGPAAEGKASFMRAISGQERPARGSVRLRGHVSAAQNGLSRRSKVQALARSDGGTATRASEVLTALRLWEFRQASVGDLTPSQVAACELLEPLVSEADLVVMDGHLDLLDPWTLAGALALIRSRTRTAFAIGTNRPDLVEGSDTLVVIRDRQIRFAGSPAELLRISPRHELTVATQKQEAVQALIEPFDVDVREENVGLVLQARDGQETAAKLLLEGYGDVRFIVSRPPTIAEALLAL